MLDDTTPAPESPGDDVHVDRSRSDHDSTDPSADDRYALILDRWRELYAPDQWPVSLVSRRLDDVRRVGQHDGANPALLPTVRFGGERVADREVVNARTGETEAAGIYRLWRRDGG